MESPGVVVLFLTCLGRRQDPLPPTVGRCDRHFHSGEPSSLKCAHSQNPTLTVRPAPTAEVQTHVPVPRAVCRHVSFSGSKKDTLFSSVGFGGLLVSKSICSEAGLSVILSFPELIRLCSNQLPYRNAARD